MVHLHKVVTFVLTWVVLSLQIEASPSRPPSLQKTTTEAPEPTPTPSTIIDILSSEVQFSKFLTALQRGRLIPFINTLQNVTVLAPVNSAFTIESLEENTLLRYIVDQRFRVGYMGRESVVFDTLYKVGNKSYSVFVSPNFDTLEYEVDRSASIVEADIHAKHQYSFVQAIDGVLPMKKTMCDVLLGDDHVLEGHGISFIKSLFTSLFLNEFDVSRKHKKKYSIIPTSCESFLSDVRTAFIPSDDMIQQSLSNITVRYYSALYHVLSSDRFSTTDEAILEIKYDITNLLRSLLIHEPVTSGNISKHPFLSMDNKIEYNISGYDDSIILNGKIQSFPNTTTSVADGVIHLFDVSNNPTIEFFSDLEISIPEIDPKKALFALHYSDLVAELEFRSSDNLIDGSTVNQTFFLSKDQRDDYIEESRDVSINSFSNKQKLQYQIASEPVNITHELLNASDERFYKLLDTSMCSKSKLNGCYRLKVSGSVDSDGTVQSRLNDDNALLSDPIEFGAGSIGYIVHSEIDPPQSFKHTLADLISNGDVSRHLEHMQINQGECLKTVQYLKDFDLLSFKDNKHGYSAFLPCGMPMKGESSTSDSGSGASWARLGLVLNYLEKNPKVFKKILQGIFVEDVIYSDFGLYGGKQSELSRNLKGDTLNITSEYFDGNYNHVLSLNDTFVPIPLNSDLLFNQGVIHIIDQLLLPSSFEVALIDLIKATQEDEDSVSFLDLLEPFPKLSEILKLDSIDQSNFSLFIPTQESLNLHNITQGFGNLLQFLEVHLIPNSQLQKIFDCISDKPVEDEFPSSQILSNNSDISFTCRKTSKGRMIFDVNDRHGESTGHKLKVISHGCTTVDSHDGSKPCVFLIDKPIDLKWLDENDGFLHIHLGFLSIAVGIILGLVIFSILTFLLMFCLSDRNAKKPKNPFTPYQEGGFMRIGADPGDNTLFDGGYETDDDMLNERDSLLPHRSSVPDRNNLVSDRTPRSYGSTSDRQKAQPVSIKGSKKTLNRVRNLPEM